MKTGKAGRRLVAGVLRNGFGLHASAPLTVSAVLDLITDVDNLENRNKRLLFALHALTKLDQDANGGIIIGPRGWQIVQDAIAREEEQ